MTPCRVSCFLFLLMLYSCATQHKPIAGIRDWAFQRSQFDPELDFSYADQVLKLTGNKRADHWARRKNIEVIAVKMINNGKRPIHGTQLQLFNGNKTVEIVQNEWLARKIRQRQSPGIFLTIPFMLIESVFWKELEEDDDDPYYDVYPDEDPPLISAMVADAEEKKRKTANFNLNEELKKFRVNSMIYRPGKVVFGVIGVRSKKPLEQLHWKVRPTDLEITDHDKKY
ncbi:MAG: hypothetical protein AB2L20_11275 [Mangrovibacterium sp.]